MKLNRRRFLSMAASQAALQFGGAAVAQALEHESAPGGFSFSDQIDWLVFLARQDMVWDRMPRNWPESPFFGNGHFALYIHEEPNSAAIRFGIDHTDVYDRRDASWGSVAYSRSRYHVGDLLLTVKGTVLQTDLRLKLEEACLEGRLQTSAGAIHLHVWVHALRDIAIVEWRTEGSEAAAWTWRAGEAISTRGPIRNAADQEKYEKLYGHTAKIWVPNPPSEESEAEGVHICAQPLLAGGGYATAWLQQGQGSSGRLVCSTAMSWPEFHSPGTARRNVQAEVSREPAASYAEHVNWWKTYYRRSFVSLPHPKLENFYWAQMYKYGCAAPKDIGIIDTHGPWLQPTSWPYITWNLNTQIAYWALQPANRLELAESLFLALDRGRQTLHENVRPFHFQSDSAVLGHCSQQQLIAPLDADIRYEREWGNLLWICNNYWLQYRYSMDPAVMRRLYPLLRSAVSFYLHFIVQGTDGYLHLPETYSPETSTTRDCNYDLALLRWGCATLIAIDRALHRDDALRSRWQELLNKLTPYPVDEHGFRVGADLTAQAHRHFSHLLMIYPLHLVSWDDPAQRPLIRTSVDYWLNAASSSGAQTGFTLAVGASMQATMRDGDRALALLEELLDSGDGRHKIMPNTMYAESGQNIESPLAAAQAIQDMLLQSWGSTLRVFPAMPAAWNDAVFHQLRAEGAFLVSARRSNGQTMWILVESLAGEPCRIRCDLPDDIEALTSTGKITVRRTQPGTVECRLGRGEKLLLRRRGSPTPYVAALQEAGNSFGPHAAGAPS